MRVADYIMQRLAEAGIGHVFLVTGRGALFLTDALAKHAELQGISVHHEQSASFAAAAYAHQTGGLGACLVSTGCASTNTITGVLSAWQDGIPCIFISGQNTLKETSRYTGIPLRTYGQQEADIISIVQPITKYAKMITSAEEIVEAMDTALTLANTGRKGPVWIDVPLDLQSAQIDPETIARASQAPVLPIATQQDMDAVVAALSAAKRPVVLIGNGLRSSGAADAFRQFVERWNVPVTFAASAPDAYGSANARSIGSVGSMGCSRAGNFAVQNADLLLVLGCRLTSLTTGPDFCKFARAAKIVVVDIDQVEHSKETVQIDRFVHAELANFLERINAADCEPANAAWMAKCQHWKAIFSGPEPDFRHAERVDLYELAECLTELMPPSSTLVTDSGLNEVILPTNIQFSDGMTAVHPAMQGAMGFALPAAIGAYYAKPQPVIAVIGDGSIMMNLQEFETIRYRNLPVKVIVINNNVYSIIRRRQQELFRKRVIGVDPANGVSAPDFSKVAACFELDYIRIDAPDQLRSGLEDLLSRDGPVLCEIMGREDQEYIELGQTRSAIDRRFVRRPLEDQAPFLDRDLFLSEMVIEPIDQ
ncbi:MULTISPECIES: thiamine pyrophosphate-binding protein [unclassified Rhizobium]|uniref:thiamine pyrophosphate-binding protein n=2 Tax=Rhizobium TaxID=379 RepID=UPI0007EA6FDE|nr:MULTISPECIES: thiamine pyrophosphate-binding protein [unclassified Rhizobium]ANK83897.1 thiamine pyrophosphate protein [Rhizobium sp. N731]ANL14145.1 thiamine pyrophosphate protein [Rhizobium sp. N1314]ARO22100.1 thiamine pyrophosphate protein [Rhizobium sp. TAL182]PDS95798.1 thiamine pyrophosphate-binding protein [Rhizobium sp. S9]